MNEREPMPAAEDDPEFQAQLDELYREMEESVPYQFGKTEKSNSPTTPTDPTKFCLTCEGSGFPMDNQPNMKHTLVKGSEAMTEDGILRLFKMLKGREATPQEVEELRAQRKSRGIEE